MYTNGSDLRDISFNLSQENYKYQNSDFNESFIEYENPCTYEEKLNLTLRTSCELIEEIVSSDEILRIEKCEDIKKDIYIEKKRYYRIFGKAIDLRGIAYKDVLVRVFKYNSYYGNVEREEVDKVFTNECGEFNFVIRVNQNANLDNYKAEIDNYYKMF